MAQPARAPQLVFPEPIGIGESVVKQFPHFPKTRPAPARQAYRILRLTYAIAPLAAGLDKFSNRLADWDRYLDERLPGLLGIGRRDFMRAVGLVEVAAGIGVAAKPRIFGYVVSGWLLGIVGNLIMKRKYYDIALRDLGLSLGALALARLARDQAHGTQP